MCPPDPPDNASPRPPEEPDPRSPLDPQRIVEGAREGVEHLVEEVREEVEELHDKIEDVVEEHLPRRVRWTAGRIAWLIVGSLVVALAILIGGGFVYVSRNSVWAAGELTRVLNQTLAQHGNLVLEVHDLRGNPFKQVLLVHPRVRVRGRGTQPILEAPSMSVAYTPWSLWGRRRSIEITLDHPVIRLARDKDGRLLLPEWKSGPRGPDTGHELELILHCRGGTVELPDSARAIEDWSFDARALTAQQTQISIQRMSWSRGPFGSSLDALVGTLSLADSVRFRIAELHSPDLALRARGAWKPGAPGLTRVISVDVDRVRWKWLAKVFSNGVFDVPGEGRGHVEARGDRDWRGSVSGEATWDSVAVAGSGDFSWIRGRLRVDPLALKSPIGTLGGRLNYTADDWELQGDVRRGDPAQWGVLGLKGWPRGNLNGRMTFRNHRQGEQHASHLEATLLPSDLAGWRADSAATTIDFPISGPDTFAVRLVRRGGTFSLLGQVGNGGWQGRYEASRYPLDEWEDGRKSGLKGLLAAGRGTVEGRDDGLHVTGALEGSSGEWLGMRAARWRLEGLEGRLLPVPALDVTTHLRDLQFLGVHFDSATARLHLGNQEVALDSVVAQAGDSLVKVSGRSAWDATGWHVILDRAIADSRQFHWIAEPPLELAGNSTGVEFRRLVASDGPARLELGGRWAVPGGQYGWSAHAERLDLSRIGLPAEWGVTGLADATLRVDGPSGNPVWKLEASVRGPGMNGHRADTLVARIEGRRGGLDVQRLTVGLDGGRLEGHVAFDRIATPWPDTLTAGAIRTWLTGSDRWEGEVAADSLPLDHLDRFAPAARDWGGRVEGRLTVAGSPRRPELVLAAGGERLRRDSLVVDEVTARAAYRDGRLDVSELRVRRGEAVSVASGWLPLKLDLASAPAIPDQPMSWRVDLTKGDLSMLPLIAPQIAQARGRVDLSARIEGTPQKPRLDGSAQVRNGVMVPAGREEVLEDVYANFRLGESRIMLDSLYAREGKRGQITGHGTIEVQGTGLKAYHLDLALREFTVHEAGFYVAQINGTAVVTDGPRVGGHIVPMITGEIALDKGVVVFDFANQAEQERLAATTQPLLWAYRIHLVALNNLRWRPPDGDIEFSADLTLEQTPGGLNIWGDMHALRGTYHFLSNKFTVNKADLTFDNVGGVNPVLDVEAVTRIVPTQGLPPPDVSGAQAESSLPHDVTVLITGRSDRPTIEFQTAVVGLPNAENDWDQARVLQELTVGRFIDKGGVSIGDPVDNYITRKLNEQLDPLLSKAFMGYVNQWTLAREQGGVFTGQGELLIKVSSQVNPQLLVSYSQKLPGFARPYTTTDPTSSGSLERNVEAEYRLNRFFFISTGYVQRRSIGTSLTGGTLGGEFDVNLKARWEY